MNQEAKEYAIQCHQDTNHRYDGKPYAHHLQMVVDESHRFKHLIPESKWQIVEDACWCHDVIEDCRQTYNDVKTATNEEVAIIVYALTNEKGKTRKERANEKYYEGIRKTRFAPFVKICDRIANYKYSLSIDSKMVKLYEKEMDEFVDELYFTDYSEMFDYLNDLPKIIQNEK